MTALAILDLGYGNTRSVALAFERLGASPALIDTSEDVDRAERLVLPGVGAAGVAMRRLHERGIAEVLRRRRKPTLGICLGMQLLFQRSEEDAGTELLGILPGEVESLRPTPGFPVPHMGWTKLDSADESMGLRGGDYCYFAHGFRCPNGEATAARATYGEAVIPAALRVGNLWGAQFHPERSSVAGARFLRTFLDS